MPTAIGRGAARATRSRRCIGLLRSGYTDVVDADLTKYFDTIPHDQLMRSVARRIVDRNMLRLIKMWLKAPVEETDKDGRKRLTGGKRQQARHAARRRDLAAARQHLHEPLPEALAADRAGVQAQGARDRLCRRLRHPQPRTCAGGDGVDAGDHSPPGAEPERDEDVACAMRTRSASTSSATPSDPATGRRMADAISAPARRRKAWPASSRGSARSCTGAIKSPGTRFAPS